MSAGICNLNCSFCLLQNKHFNSVKEEHKQIIDAWKNNTYLNNVEQYFIKHNENFYNVKELCLWGGESLLNIDLITPNVKQIFQLFPNLSNWFISTNFIININNFIDFLISIDNNATKQQIFSLQLSIDGPPELIFNCHNGDWNIYDKNLEALITYFNTHIFHYLTLEISINSVLPKETFLQELNTKEKIIKYLEFMHNFYQKHNITIINQNIKLNFEYCLPKVDHLAKMTIDERNQFLAIYNLFESTKNYFDNIHYKKLHLYHGINHYLLQNTNLFAHDNECGALNTMITLLPDGREIRCSGAYMANNTSYENELKKENDFNNLIIYQVETKTSNNSLINTALEQTNYEWNIKNGIKNTKKVYTKMIFGECLELLKVNQISEKYYNKEQLLKEITGLMRKFSCDEENVKETYNPFIPSLDLLRRYFNGLSNLVYQNTFIEEQEKWNLN